MDLNLSVLRLASGLASYAMTRQTVIAENVANADTPGYRARDVDSFATAVEGSDMPFIARRTRPEHIPFGTEANGFGVHDASVVGAETPNGNTVSLEDQMMRAANVRESHEMALGVYAKSLEILRSALGKG